MKILITGATGYIGYKLAMEAARRNYTVHILVRDLQSPLLPVHPNIIKFKGDITDKISVMSAMMNCDKVIHAAAIAKLSAKDNNIFYSVNVEGTRNMLDAALALGVKKFVFTSSGAVIGPSGKYPMSENDPRITAFENDYEISKHWAEELVKAYSRRGLFAVIVVAPRVYGPGHECNGNTMDVLLKSILSMRLAFVPSYDNVVANYAFVDDVVNGHFLAMDKGLGGEKYILGGENLSYRSLFQTIKQNTGKKIRLIRIPKLLLKIWSFFYKSVCALVGKETHISPKVVDRLAQNRALSCDKAIKQLGYSITPFSVGIQITILHLKNQKYA
ncbi:MAG TPA: NAD-dependent epimerase/dehydratase family protein [Chitinophagaceae bacterium]|jgi:nucleoside-diphosphate-sugar epimerase|nr:NAD-dependent epimerase/dehydratase family protein [Chitinophagaceae bacterium]